MKRKLHFRYNLMAVLMFLTSAAYAQINYSANFNEDEDDWESWYFYQDTDYDCTGGGSLVFNLYSWDDAGDLISPSVGTSTGNTATLTYSYKLLNYEDDTAVQNSQDWGLFQIYWAPSLDGPINLLQTVDTSNHVPSTSCATQTVTFTPPVGSQIYIYVYAELGDYSNDINFIFDQVSVTQAALPACAGTPAAATAVASTGYLCNGGTATLSLESSYLFSGLTYQWQISADNITYTNVSTGGTSASYSTTQAASTWYRVRVTCTASGEFVYSAPVQVVNTGLDCPCDVEFDEGVEPITHVTFAGIDNDSSAIVDGSPGVEDFSGVTPAEVTAGETYPIVLQGNTAGDFDNFFTVYFDWNHNGDFTDEGEEYQIGMITESTGIDDIQAEGDIEVPDDALAGLTYMRVFKSFDAYTDDPCSSEAGYGYGQAEDYLVNVTVPCTTPAPEAEELQVVCSGATIADLSAEGTVNKWYTAATGGTELIEETVLTEITYYVSQIPEGGCESEERTAVTVQFSVIPPPTADSTIQLFCEEGYVADLEVEADGEVVWYTSETGEDVVSDETELVDGTTYYASQFIDGCESATRTAVTATISVVEAPEATSPQTFELEEDEAVGLDDIVVTAEGSLTWYGSEEDAEDNQDALNPETYEIAIGETVTVYVVQTIGECVSEPTAITVTATLGSDEFALAGLKYYPNPVNDVFNLSYTNAIDLVEVYNIVGQCVVRHQPAQADVVLNLGDLQAGTYMVKVQSGSQTGVIKIVKQ